jgi:hypothetical protein
MKIISHKVTTDHGRMGLILLIDIGPNGKAEIPPGIIFSDDTRQAMTESLTQALIDLAKTAK